MIDASSRVPCSRAPPHTHLVVADFDVLLHDDPGDRLGQRGGGQRAVVRPVVLRVGRKEAGGVEPGKLHHAALHTGRTGQEFTSSKKSIYPPPPSLMEGLTARACPRAPADLVSDSRQGVYQLLQPFVSLSHLHQRENKNPDYSGLNASLPRNKVGSADGVPSEIPRSRPGRCRRSLPPQTSCTCQSSSGPSGAENIRRSKQTEVFFWHGSGEQRC